MTDDEIKAIEDYANNKNYNQALDTQRVANSRLIRHCHELITALRAERKTLKKINNLARMAHVLSAKEYKATTNRIFELSKQTGDK